MKKALLLTMIMVLSFGLLVGCGKKKKNDNNNEGNNGNVQENKPVIDVEIKTNNNPDVIGEQSIENLKISNVSLVYDGNSTFEASVTNLGTETSYLVRINVHVMNGEEELVVLDGYIGSNIEPNETRELSATFGDDITTATSVRYEIVRE